MPKPFNIIYFVCHDLGRHLGCYGHPVATPNIDAFARDGVLFEHAHCSSPACSPSRACVMTGQYAHVHGCIGLSHMGWGLRPEIPTIVEHLSAAGYETAHVGTEHEWHPRSGRYDREGDRAWADWTTENALEDARTFLRTRDNGQPFYLNIGTQEDHASEFTRPAVVESRYGGPIPADETFVPPYLEDNTPNREFLSNFQSAIRYLDKQWGAFMEFIRQSEYADNTLIIFSTDHGIAIPTDRPRCSKGTLYERGTAISLAMRLPQGMKQGYRFDGLIPNIDLTPTLLDMAGAPIPDTVNGRSFWPLLQGQAYKRHEQIFTERNYHGEKFEAGSADFVDFLDPIRSVRTEQYHYLRWFDPDAMAEPTLWAMREVNDPHSHERLYDCLHDPMQTIDLKRRPEYGAILADLRGRLERWMHDTDDWLLQSTTPIPPVRPEEPGWGEGWPLLAERVPWDGR